MATPFLQLLQDSCSNDAIEPAFHSLRNGEMQRDFRTGSYEGLLALKSQTRKNVPAKESSICVCVLSDAIYEINSERNVSRTIQRNN